ncbi:MAG: hypothetical protein GY953_56385, partial [bacterium]|nr:hypothetical protein [bacterium]
MGEPGGTPGTAYSGWSDPLGVVVGPNIEAIEPAALGVGAVAEPVTLYGQGLAGVDSLIIEPADGITLSAPEAAADGGMVTAYVSVAADAVHGLRRIVPSGTDQPYRVVFPGADLLNITPPQPIIDALEP